MKRAFGSALAVGLAVVLGVPGVASAAWHDDTPARVVSGWTDSAQPGQAFPGTPTTDLPIGTWLDAAGVSHTSRVYATFDLSPYEGKKVSGGQVFVNEKSVSDCTKRSVEIWRTKAISAAPTWKKPPAPLSKLDEETASQFCPRGLAFDVSAAITEAVAAKQRLVTFELRVAAGFEADPAYGRTLNRNKNVELSLAYNTAPKIDNAHLYHGGLPCTQLKPYPKRASGNWMQALAVDPDGSERLTTEFAYWPVGRPDDRSTVPVEGVTTTRVATADMAADKLVHGKSYGWQARVSDGTETSAWSKKCFFTYDGVDPSAPAVSSANPLPGVHPEFVFDGHRDKDIVGFRYSWFSSGVTGVCRQGDLGQWVCPDPFAVPQTVRADTPGGKATITINPDQTGQRTLYVRSVDAAGNLSPITAYDLLISGNEPTVTEESGPPRWNRPVRLKLTPHAGVTGVKRYSIERVGHEGAETVDADVDGVAYYEFTPTNETQETLHIRSHDDFFFVSAPTEWVATFAPFPEITADIYAMNLGDPVGGVGVEGTFDLFPPAGWREVASYRYSFDGEESTTVEADAEGLATFKWAPTTPGSHTIEVYAVKPDGEVSFYSNYYGFEVAG